jgi:hypothetical protein
MGLLETLAGGLVPVGMAVGGLLGEVLPIRVVISLAFVISGIISIPPLFAPSIRRYFSQEIS